MIASTPLALAPPPARTIVTRLMSDRLAKRLLSLEDAAPIVGYSVKRIEDFIGDGSIPVVRLPSTSDDPTWSLRRIPVVWLPRLLQMHDRSRCRVSTARSDIGGQPGEPLAVSVAIAAAAVGLSHVTAYKLINEGRFAPTIAAPGGTTKVMVDELDGWVWSLIADAETAWYGLDGLGKAVGR